MQVETLFSQPASLHVWRDGEHVCAIADDTRHFGHVVLTDQWHAYDGTKLNDSGTGFKYLGAFETAGEGKAAVERSIAAAVRPEVKKARIFGFEGNKEICRRLHEEAIGKGNLDVINVSVSTDCRTHDPAFPSLQPGAEGLRQHINELRHAFPDLSCTCDDIIAERDEVVIHWTTQGTHRGVFLDFPPTNRSMMVSGTSIHRLEGGRIVELWKDWNLKSAIDQLGLGMSGHEANKRLVQRYVSEVWNRKKPEMIGHFVARDYTRHSPGGFLRGVTGLKQDYENWVSAFPDCHIQIDDATCEGERVFLRFRFTVTHERKLTEVTDSRRTVSVPGFAFFRIVNGKIAEEQIVLEGLEMARRIGPMPYVKAAS